MASEGFASLLLKLGARVRQLGFDGQGLSAPDLEEEIGKCHSWLMQLEHRAEDDSLDLTPFYEPIVDIRSRLGHLAIMLAKRRQPWWKRALYAIGHLLNGLGFLFGLPPLLPVGPSVAGLLEGPMSRDE